MVRLLLALCWLLLLCGGASAAPSFATLVGTVEFPAGTPCALCQVTIRTVKNQNVGGILFVQQAQGDVYFTDTLGALPVGVVVAKTLVVGITVAFAPEVQRQIPSDTTVDIATLLNTTVNVPPSTNINSIAGTPLCLSGGGTCATTWTAAKCVRVNDAGTKLEAAPDDCGSGGGGGSSAFADLTSGTNSTAAMRVGTGASLAATGSGTIAATTAAALAANPTDCVAGTFATTIAANGNLTCSKPSPIFRIIDYGALCDGSTDDTAAIANAMAAMTDGGVLEFPLTSGGCVFTSIDQTAATGHGIHLKGQCKADNNDCTNLRCNNASGTCITMGTDGTLEDFALKVKSGVSQTTANTYINIPDGSSRVRLNHLLGVDPGSGLCGTCLRVGSAGVRATDILGFVPVANGIGVHLINAVSAFFDFVNVNASNSGTVGWKNEQTGIGQPDSNIFYNSGSDGAGIALWLLAADAAKAPRWQHWVNFQAESTAAETILIESCRDCVFTDSYVLGGTNTVKITGGSGIQFNGGLLFGAQQDVLVHENDSDTELNNVTVADGGQSLTDCSGTKYSAVKLASTSRHFRMNGGQLADGFYFTAGKSCYGATCVSGADEYAFRDMRCDDNTTACHNSCNGPTTPGARSDRIDFLPATSGRVASDQNLNLCYDADTSATNEGINFVTNACSTVVGGVSDSGLFVNAARTVSFYDSDSSNFVGVKAPATVASDRTITWPDETGTVCTTGSVCTGYQASDADLTALAALSGTGIPARTASNTWALRSIAEGLAIDVTDGDGVSGNPTIAFDPTELTGNRTWAAGGSATIAWTIDLSGTDPVITFGSSSVDVTTGTLKQGGTAVVLQSRTITGGAGIGAIGDLSSDRTIATASGEADFVASGALTCGAATQGKMQVHTTPLQYCDNAATPTLQYAAYGSSTGVATSATALAANPTDCGANQFANAIAASGNLTCAQPAFSDLSGSATDAQIPDTISLTNITQIGTRPHSSLTSLSADDHTQYLLLAGRTLSDPGGSQTTIATQPETLTLGTAFGGFRWLSWNAAFTQADFANTQVFSVNGSLRRTGTGDPGFLYSIIPFFSGMVLDSVVGDPFYQDAFTDFTSIQVSGGATAPGNSSVPLSLTAKNLFYSTASSSLHINTSGTGYSQPTLKADFGSTTTMDLRIAWWVDDTIKTGTGTTSLVEQDGFYCANLTAATTNICYKSIGTGVLLEHAGRARFGATGAPTGSYKLDVQGDTDLDGLVLLDDSMPDITSSTTRNSLTWAPTVSIGGSGTPDSTLRAIYLNPAVTQNGNGTTDTARAKFIEVSGTMTDASTATLTFPTFNGVLVSTVLSSTAASRPPVSTSIGFSNALTSSYNVSSGTIGGSSAYGFTNDQQLINVQSGGTITFATATGFKDSQTFTETAGVLNITDHRGFWATNPAIGGTPQVTNSIGFDADSLTRGGTLNVGFRTAQASGTGNWAFLATGTGNSAFAGNVRLGDNTAPTTLLDLAGKLTFTSAGIVTKFNNIATASLGVPVVYSQPAISATKTANFTVLSYTPPATAGAYRVGAVITTTSGTNTGTLQCTVDYVDSQGTTHTADVIPIAGAAGTFAATVANAASKEFHCSPTELTVNNSATAIVLKVVISLAASYTVTGTVEQVL